MKFLNERINSIKWDKTDVFYGKKDLLPLWVADMDIKSPKELLDNLNELTKKGDFGYTFKGEDFYKSISLWYEKRYGVSIHPKKIIGAQGVVHSISMLIEIFSNIDDEIIIQSPIYPPFFKIINALKRKVVFNSLCRSNKEYSIDFYKLEKSITNKTRILLLCNPHNPTGKVFSIEELKKLEEICKKNNILIISDEIHGDLVYQKKHKPFFSISDWAKENSIILNSPAKTFNCPSLLVSYLIVGNLEYKKKIKTYMEIRHLGEINSFGLEGIKTLYNKCDYWLNELLELLEENYLFIESYLSNKLPKIEFTRPQGTYLIWLNFEKYNLPYEKLEEIFVNDCNLALSRGSDFGIEGQGFMRLNFGTSKKILKEALERIYMVFSKF